MNAPRRMINNIVHCIKSFFKKFYKKIAFLKKKNSKFTTLLFGMILSFMGILLPERKRCGNTRSIVVVDINSQYKRCVSHEEKEDSLHHDKGLDDGYKKESERSLSFAEERIYIPSEQKICEIGINTAIVTDHDPKSDIDLIICNSNLDEDDIGTNLYDVDICRVFCDPSECRVA